MVANCLPKKHSGTSLVEILVIITITLLLTTGVVLNMTTGRNIRKLQSTAQIIQSKLYEARAVALNLPNDAPSGVSFIDFTLITDPATQYLKSIDIVYKLASGPRQPISGHPIFTNIPSKKIKVAVSDGFINEYTQGGEYKIPIYYNANSPGSLGSIDNFTGSGPEETITLTDESGSSMTLKINKYSGVVNIE